MVKSTSFLPGCFVSLACQCNGQVNKTGTVVADKAKEEGIESLLQFWNADCKIIKSLSGSKAEYRNIRWNKDGTLLATVSDAMRLWTNDGQLLYSGQSEDLIWGIDWVSQCKNIITTSEKGNINLWTATAELLNKIP
jgi:WD40 repeat protein